MTVEELPRAIEEYRQLTWVKESGKAQVPALEHEFPDDLFPRSEFPPEEVPGGEEAKPSGEQEQQSDRQTETEKEIEALFDELKCGKAKRDALRKNTKYANDPEALVAKLRKDVEKAKAAKAKRDKQKTDKAKPQATFF